MNLEELVRQSKAIATNAALQAMHLADTEEDRQLALVTMIGQVLHHLECSVAGGAQIANYVAGRTPFGDPWETQVDPPTER